MEKFKNYAIVLASASAIAISSAGFQTLAVNKDVNIFVKPAKDTLSTEQFILQLSTASAKENLEEKS